jgi:hypothetical protein
MDRLGSQQAVWALLFFRRIRLSIPLLRFDLPKTVKLLPDTGHVILSQHAGVILITREGRPAISVVTHRSTFFFDLISNPQKGSLHI